MRRALLALACCGKPAATPVVAEHPAAPPPPPAIDAAVAVDPCAETERLHKEWEAARQAEAEECTQSPSEFCGMDSPGPPQCWHSPIEIADIAPPWTGGDTGCANPDSHYGDPTCWITLTLAAGGEITVDSGFAEVTRFHPLALTNVRAVDLIAGGAPELVVELHLDDRDGTDRLVVCRAEPAGCSEPIATSGETDTGDVWTTLVRVDGRRIVLDPDKGTPPAGVLGPHVPKFDSRAPHE